MAAKKKKPPDAQGPRGAKDTALIRERLKMEERRKMEGDER